MKKTNLEKEKVFFDGEMFDAKSFISNIISNANTSIILIDAYADIKALEFLKYKKQGVKLSIYHSSKAKLSNKEVLDFNAQYGDCSTFINDKYHDRFLVIDQNDIFHLARFIKLCG